MKVLICRLMIIGLNGETNRMKGVGMTFDKNCANSDYMSSTKKIMLGAIKK